MHDRLGGGERNTGAGGRSCGAEKEEAVVKADKSDVRDEVPYT